MKTQTKTKPKTKTSALTVAGNQPVIAVMQPPPRKSEIVAALVERARVQHAEEMKAKTQQADALWAGVTQLVLKEFRAAIANPDANLRVNLWGGQNMCVNWDGVATPEIRKANEAYKKVRAGITSFDPKRTKQEILFAMGTETTTERVQKLLTDPESVKKLDGILASLGK